MAKIKQLSQHEAQKIAAGEVVERPANVVKELVENAIDAGATSITVYLEEGGRDLIRIVDNGCGMSQEDAHLCFAQHATSKISSVDDLNTITTFGFRGEALASIASVSHVTLITREQNPENENLSGIKLELSAGQQSNKEIISCMPGTDIAVKNIFYNLPARQKFLKKKETESRQITQLLHAFCLDYLPIHFSLIHNGKEVLNCPATDDIISRVAQIWDHTVAKQIIPLGPVHQNGVTLSGAISNHQYFRYDSSNIFLFVNKRWIKDLPLSRALLRGYTNVLPPARYPCASIFIEVDPAHVDINIHPKKEEVQFLHPRTIESLLQSSVKAVLEEHLSAQIKQPVSFSQARYEAPTPFPQQKSFQPFDFGRIPEPFAQHQPAIVHSQLEKPAWHDEPMSTPYQPMLQTLAEPDINMSAFQAEQNTTQEASFQVIGQYNNTYILIERPNGLFLIDQHAAHERILYELFSKRFQDVATVTLMFPEIITLSSDDMAAVADKLEIFTENGINLEQFSENQLIVQSTPVHLKNIKLDEFIRDTAAWVREFDSIDRQTLFTTLHEKLRAQMACKAAVKAGDPLTHDEMTKLLQDLEKTDNRLTCPHGRPTGWLLSLYDIEKRFKRKL